MKQLTAEVIRKKRKVFENFKTRRVHRLRERLPKAKYTIYEVVKMADEAGMSYGHFVAMKYREGERL